TMIAARARSRQLRAVVERLMGRYVAVGDLDEDGDAIAAAMQQEADAIVFEANDDHGRIAAAAMDRFPTVEGRPLAILTLGSTGTLAGGQSGTALSAITAAAYGGREIQVFVLEGRPNLDGARLV